MRHEQALHAQHLRLANRLLPAMGLAAVLLVAGCSDSTVGNSKGKPGGATLGPGGVDLKTLILDTDVGDKDARAGIAFAVKCRLYKPAAKGATGPGEELTLPSSATVVVVDGPQPPLGVDGVSVRLAKVGAYHVACSLAPKYALTDATPAELTVVPGPPEIIDTTVLGKRGDPPGTPPPAQVTAGSKVVIGCTASDKYGNEIEEGFGVQTDPASALPPVGNVIMPTKAGITQVACTVEGVADPTPATLLVVHDVPRHLFTLLDPGEVPAGGAAKLACVAQDAYGNVITDFPFALDFGPEVTIKGTFATATKAGLHKVQCVPETVAWDLFTLHPAVLSVVPGPPASLEVSPVPAKPVYKQQEKVKFIAAVFDIYKNLIPNAKVAIGVTSPAQGFQAKGADTFQFNDDNTYAVHAEVVGSEEVFKDLKILVDGSPPLLTIDYPPWGTELDGKPSVKIKGTAGDPGSGVKTLIVNGKSVGVALTPCKQDSDCTSGDTGGGVCVPELGDPTNGNCSVGEWQLQWGALHGLNMVLAQITDIGGLVTKATRGFYYGGKYYPTDAAKPNGAMVEDGLQIFLGQKFIDDGVHDPNHPDDMATLMEVLIGGLDVNSLIPPNISQGGINVTISNVNLSKPAISLKCIKGGIDMLVEIAKVSADVSAKTKVLGISVGASGTVTISKISVHMVLMLGVTAGVASVSVPTTDVQILDLNLKLNGLGGLLNGIIDMIIGGFTGQIEDMMKSMIAGQVTPLIQGLLAQFAINQAIPLPALIPGMPATTISLVSNLHLLEFNMLGGTVKMNTSIVAPKGTAHTVLGSIGRAGCMGTVPDVFTTDTTQRLQLAVHDDVINQALYAIWYGGSMKLQNLQAKDLGLTGDAASMGGFSLDGAVFGADLFLPPILESCNMPTPMDVRIQVGDLFGEATLAMGDTPLTIGLFASLDIGATIGLGVDAATGAQALSVVINPKLNYQMELVSITKDFEGMKASLQTIIEGQLSKALANGVPGLDKIAVPLPALDLGSLLPGMAPGTKIVLKLKDLKRAGGFTAINAELQ